MPIRFYCPFCDRLLGISRRKIGAVVECPACHGRVGVPSDRPAPGGPAPPPLPGLPVTLASPASADILLTRPQILALGLALLLLLALSFAAGLLLGALS